MSLDFTLVGRTLHTNPSFEECDIDGILKVEHVDAETAAALLSLGQATACEHCNPDPADQIDSPTLNTRGPDD